MDHLLHELVPVAKLEGFGVDEKQYYEIKKKCRMDNR